MSDGGLVPGNTRHFGSLDAIRVLATLFVAWYHFLGAAIERLDGSAHAQVEAWIATHPWFTSVHFLLADLALRLFLFLSAFSLTYHAARRGGLELRRWYVARARRLYPAIWVSLVLVCAWSYWRTRHLLRPWTDLAWCAIGLPHFKWMTPVAGSWWFVGVIVSFYLVFPALFALLRRGLAIPLVGFAYLVSLVSQQLLAPHLLGVFHDPGGFLGARMLDLGLGMALGHDLAGRGDDPLAPWRRWPIGALLAGLATAGLAVWGPTTLLPPGGSLAHFAIFCALIALLEHLPDRVLHLCSRLSGPSLLFYLLHYNALVPYLDAFAGGGSAWVVPLFAGFAVALWITCVALDVVARRLGRQVFGTPQGGS